MDHWALNLSGGWQGLIKLSLMSGLSLLMVACELADQADNNSIALLSPQGPARQIQQQIVAEWQGQQQTLIVALELDQQHIAMAGLSGDGLSLFNLRYDGQSLTLDKSPLLPESLSPRQIVADLQLIYWPAEALRRQLSTAWRLDDLGLRRVLYRDNVKWAEVIYESPASEWPHQVQLNNEHYRYRLNITTLSYERLPE